jgi:hypothetical protein
MEKLALVIRPPNQPTRLYLESMDDSKTPLEGFDIYSRRPSAKPGEPNEYLGKTDWQGMIEIPPGDEGLRLILVSRGSRGLKRLPIIPGLHAELRSSVPNDETSLFAQGVIAGLEKEILSLVIQRQVFESDIAAALEEKNLAEAKIAFKQYQSLESPRDLKSRLADEEVRLKAMTEDKRETEFIITRFGNLRKLVSQQINTNNESDLQSEIQKQSNLPGAG